MSTTDGDQRITSDPDESVDATRNVTETAPRSPLAFLPLSGTPQRVVEWVAVVVAIYLMITAVGLIGSGFSSAAGDQADELFSFAANPFVGLMIGVLATVLTQSSSTTTSVTVGMVAGGLPIEIAIPILMGANIGTTVTSTLVSLGMARDRETFRRAFGAASVHDMYNLLAVVIFLPLELVFGYLERISEWFAGVTTGEDGGIVATAFTAFGDTVSAITSPGADLVEWLLTPLGTVAAGIVMILLGVGLILLIINWIGRMLKSLLVGKAETVFHNAIGRGPVSGITSGCLITLMVQSSSTTTALAVPLAGSGKFTIWQIYPFTVGANVGTTLTALIAAFGFSGVEGTVAMQAAAVHLLFNLSAAVLIFLLPFLRPLPVRGAQILADLGARRKIYVAVWVLGIFVVIPLVLILLTV